MVFNNPVKNPTISSNLATTYHSLSGRVNHDDDDEDVAKLEDIVGFFTGLLNTTTVCAGLGSLNNLKKHYLDVPVYPFTF